MTPQMFRLGLVALGVAVVCLLVIVTSGGRPPWPLLWFLGVSFFMFFVASTRRPRP